MLQPSLRSRRISTSAFNKLPMAALSVNSKQSEAGFKPLPSTSPANASWSYARKLEAWAPALREPRAAGGASMSIIAVRE